MTAPFLPDGLLAALARQSAPRVDPAKILAGLERAKVQPRPGIGAFLPFAENARCYGFEFPREVRELLRIADEWALEEVATVSFRYFRVVAQDWELPEALEGRFSSPRSSAAISGSPSGTCSSGSTSPGS